MNYIYILIILKILHFNTDLKVISCLAETRETQLKSDYFDVTVTFGEIPRVKCDLILNFLGSAFVKLRS